ncbi:hypothetical protein [Candidatus Regiella insecticola]|uniref:hypothetical protein n=1 Tax=Candidatus Regiella insecticola TaxID=138073 RepID=UPI002A4E2C6E|nr:hypothetical protein [Candidatus Regiella insecticola]
MHFISSAITAATSIMLDSPVVTCTQQLIIDSLQVNRGGNLRGDLTLKVAVRRAP